jgi:hypothetical protein
MGIQKEIFYKNLKITQQYCAEQLKNENKSIAEILRSINLDFNGQKIFQYYNSPTSNDSYWTSDPLTDMKIYPTLFQKQMTHKEISVGNKIPLEINEGKILVAEIYETVCDAASTVESFGLIDEIDCPAIDTWFYFDENFKLYCWVPQRFVEIVNESIEVNCMKMLYWFDETDSDKFH